MLVQHVQEVEQRLCRSAGGGRRRTGAGGAAADGRQAAGQHAGLAAGQRAAEQAGAGPGAALPVVLRRPLALAPHRAALGAACGRAHRIDPRIAVRRRRRRATGGERTAERGRTAARRGRAPSTLRRRWTPTARPTRCAWRRAKLNRQPPAIWHFRQVQHRGGAAAARERTGAARGSWRFSHSTANTRRCCRRGRGRRTGTHRSGWRRLWRARWPGGRARRLHAWLARRAARCSSAASLGLAREVLNYVQWQLIAARAMTACRG